MWILFGLGSALCETINDAIGQGVTRRTDEYVAAFGRQFWAAIVLTPLLVFSGLPFLKDGFWLWLLVAAIIGPMANIFYKRALKTGRLSEAIPLLALSPIFTAAILAILSGTTPSILGWAGMLLIAIGIHIIYRKSDGQKVSSFHRIWNDIAARSMIYVCMLWSIGAIVSSNLVHSSSPIFAAWSFFVVGSTVLACTTIKFSNLGLRGIMKAPFKLMSLGVTKAASEMFLYSGLQVGYVPYVIALKRTTIVWSSLVGMIFLKEPVSLKNILGVLMSCAGAVLLTIN